MKEIKLTQNQVVLVDDEGFEWLSRWWWCTHWNSCTKSFYAIRRDTDRCEISMSREIMNCPDDMLVDHKNHNTLDNQRINLRVCTPNQNQQNQRPQINCISRYKGVCWHKRAKQWIAQIQTRDIFDRPMHIHLGCFKVEKEAALAYDKAASEEFGEFACLNFQEKDKC